MDVMTIADDLIVCHDGARVIRLEGLDPASTHEVHGARTTTLETPPWVLLCRFTTVNGVHFGEVECGWINDTDSPGERPLDSCDAFLGRS